MGSVFPVALSHFPNERIAVDKFIRSVYTGIYTVSLKRWHGILRSQTDIEIIEVQKWLYVIRAYTIQTTHFRPLPEKYNFLITLLVRPNLCSGLNLYFSGPKLYILYIMVRSIKWRVHVIKSKTIATNTFQARAVRLATGVSPFILLIFFLYIVCPCPSACDISQMGGNLFLLFCVNTDGHVLVCSRAKTRNSRPDSLSSSCRQIVDSSHWIRLSALIVLSFHYTWQMALAPLLPPRRRRSRWWESKCDRDAK